jgi:hypothetical protein
VNPDCSTKGSVTIRVVEPPQNGRVGIVSAKVFPGYSESNPRSHCNQRGVTGKEAKYTSRRGYTGPDHVAIEVIFPDGKYRRLSYSIVVK